MPAAQEPPCPPGSPSLSFTVNGGGGPVYTTQDLVFRVRVPGVEVFDVMSFDVSGARRLPRDVEEGRGLAGDIYATADSPGTLMASATVEILDAAGDYCSLSGSARFEAREATRPAVSRLRRPRKYKAKRGRLFSSTWSFSVRAGATGNRSPLTVEARAVRRARVPRGGVAAAQRAFVLRESDAPPEIPPARSGCSDDALICPTRLNTWPLGAEVRADETGGRVVPDGVTVSVALPVGAPRGRRVVRTPVGVDVKVLQNGAAVARLRIAGRCRADGQFAVCRFKTLSTRL